MNWTDVPAGTINAAQQRLWVALGDDADVVASRINNDSGFVRELALFARNGGFEPSTSQKRAREIMGRNCFGVEEAIRHFGVNPSKAQLAALSEVPFSEETLESCKDTHVLVAVFPLSILDIRTKVKDESTRLIYDQSWYNKESFAKNRGEISWQLVRKTPVENSTSKNWDEQQSLLGENDVTPTAHVMVYTIIGHYRATGERLFESIYVRCSDLDSDGDRVSVGYFVASGLGVNGYWVDLRGSHLGVSSSRKF